MSFQSDCGGSFYKAVNLYFAQNKKSSLRDGYLNGYCTRAAC